MISEKWDGVAQGEVTVLSLNFLSQLLIHKDSKLGA